MLCFMCGERGVSYTPKIDLEFNSKKYFYAHPNKELSLRSNFPIIGHKMARIKIMDIFYDEKKKLFDYFSSLDCRFSYIMD